MRLLLAAAALGLVVPVTPGPPDLTIRYERPLYGARHQHAEAFDHYGARWFDFWKDKHGFGHIPGAGKAKNCLRADLHFCIHVDEFLFAVPPHGAKPGAKWMVDHYVKFRLLSIRTVRFRGRDIEAYLIKADTGDTPDGIVLSSVFSYNYDWGVIGYAEVWSENYYFRDSIAPWGPGLCVGAGVGARARRTRELQVLDLRRAAGGQVTSSSAMT